MASYPNLLSIGALTEVREETVILNDSPRNLRKQWHRDVERYDDMVWHQVAQDFDERRPPLGPNVSDDNKYQRKAVDDGNKKKSKDLKKEGKDMAWLLAKVAEPTKTQQALPLAMPETVIVEKGRPAKLYYLDPERDPGRLQVHKNQRNELQMGGLVKTFFQLHKKRWIRRMRDMFGDAMPRGKHFEKLQAKSEMLRLTYADGEIRILTHGDVEKMLMSREFTRQFWQPVAMLQTIPWLDGTYLSYQYSHVGAQQRTTHLGESFAADVEPMRSGPPHSEWVNTEQKMPNVWEYSDVDKFEEDELENPRMLTLPDTSQLGRAELAVEEIPNTIREHLLERYWDLRSGTFEFIRDGHDGSLWLCNACRIKCVYKGPDPIYIDPVKQEEERLAKLVRYFREDEWLGDLEAHQERLRKFGEHEAVIQRKERVEYAKQMFKDMAGGIGEDISAEVQAVMAVPPRIIPIFTGTSRKELRAWFKDTEPVEKPDPVAEVIRALALEPAKVEGEAVELPKSDDFKAEPLNVTLGLVASKDRSVVAWSREVNHKRELRPEDLRCEKVEGPVKSGEAGAYLRRPLRNRSASFLERSGAERERTIKAIGSRMLHRHSTGFSSRSTTPSTSIPISPSMRSKFNSTASSFNATGGSLASSATSSRLQRTASAVF